MTVATKIRSSATSIPEGELAQQLLADEFPWFPFEVPDHSTAQDVRARSFQGIYTPSLTGAYRLSHLIECELATPEAWDLSLCLGEVAHITRVIEPQSNSELTSQLSRLVLVAEHATNQFSFLLRSLLQDEPTVDPLEGYEEYAVPNWDGEDARPIAPQTLQYARRLLEVMPATFGAPDIAPSADGSIGLEWVPEAGPLRKLFFDIGPGEEWRAYWSRRNGEFGRLPGEGFPHDIKRVLQALFDALSK